jgi:hypothetical protein
MSKHTPEPWTYDIGIKGYHVFDADNITVCTLRTKDTARLIAAAPDLLAALKLCAETLQGCDPGNPEDETGWENRHLFEPWLAARNAIAKAEGAS